MAELVIQRTVNVAYSQFRLTWGPGVAVTQEEVFQGQANGLCGAAVANQLFLVTGLHTGPVDVTVERHEQAPPVSDAWQDVVEVSCIATSEGAALQQWDGERYPIDVPPGRYRVRYCASGMDEGAAEDTLVDDDPIDHYLLQLWPGEQAADRILRQSSDTARYWHQARAGSPGTPTDALTDDDAERWGIRVPNQRLRVVEGRVRAAELLDMDLTFAIAEADDATQRAVARWAAQQAYALAGLAELPVLAPAMAALRAGRTVPAPFDDYSSVWGLLSDVGPRTTIRLPPQLGTKTVSQQDAAIPALPATAEADSLQAALDALVAAAKTHGPDYPRLFAALRQDFPQLA